MSALNADIPRSPQQDAPTADDFVALVGLGKDFGGETVVRDLSLSLRRGEFFSLLGPSGCGKTTTLRMIAGFEQPSRGRVFVDGEDLTGVVPNRRPVNTVFQSYALFSHLDVAGNVAFGLREDRVPRSERRDRVAEALALVRLEGFERRRPAQLSGGQQQRVALARAIVMRPRVLLLDEPLGALDLQLRKVMQIELKQIQERLGMTFVYVTHDQEEALTMSDRIAVMKDGRIEQIGTPEEIYDRPASRYVAEFIGAANCIPGVIGPASGSGFDFLIGDDVRVPVSAPAPGPAGAPGFVVIRPERCEAIAGSQPHGLNGRVTEVLFKGMYRSYLVDVGNGVTVVVAAPHRPSGPQQFQVGAQVVVAWPPDESTIVLD
jgi:spermidine/putrescine transport system ATP-binding protein